MYPGDGGGIKLEPFKIVGHPVNDRWKHFLDYLELHGEEYSQVLCMDTRDAIFQGDVFKCFVGKKNYLGYATQPCMISPTMPQVLPQYEWMTRFFGKDEADKLIGKKVLCIGTVVGTINEMETFCRKIWEYSPVAAHGADEATEHYIMYNNLLPVSNLVEMDCDSGAIFTSHWFHICNPVETRGDKILRGDGGVPAVVHAYDRQPSLVALVDGLYRDKNFQADERFSDPRSLLEQATNLLYIGKISDAAQLFMKYFPDGANLGGNVDAVLRLWDIALKKPPTPAAGYIELSIQAALKGGQGISGELFNKIINLLAYAVRNNRVIDYEFKIAITNVALKIVEQNLNVGNSAACFYFLDLINALNFPPSKDFYLMQARVYRTFGKKEEALAAYQKVLDLS